MFILRILLIILVGLPVSAKPFNPADYVRMDAGDETIPTHMRFPVGARNGKIEYAHLALPLTPDLLRTEIQKQRQQLGMTEPLTAEEYFKLLAEGGLSSGHVTTVFSDKGIKVVGLPQLQKKIGLRDVIVRVEAAAKLIFGVGSKIQGTVLELFVGENASVLKDAPIVDILSSQGWNSLEGDALNAQEELFQSLFPSALKPSELVSTPASEAVAPTLSPTTTGIWVPRYGMSQQEVGPVALAEEALSTQKTMRFTATSLTDNNHDNDGGSGSSPGGSISLHSATPPAFLKALHAVEEALQTSGRFVLKSASAMKEVFSFVAEEVSYSKAATVLFWMSLLASIFSLAAYATTPGCFAFRAPAPQFHFYARAA